MYLGLAKLLILVSKVTVNIGNKDLKSLGPQLPTEQLKHASYQCLQNLYLRGGLTF